MRCWLIGAVPFPLSRSFSSGQDSPHPPSRVADGSQDEPTLTDDPRSTQSRLDVTPTRSAGGAQQLFQPTPRGPTPLVSAKVALLLIQTAIHDAYRLQTNGCTLHSTRAIITLHAHLPSHGSSHGPVPVSRCCGWRSIDGNRGGTHYHLIPLDQPCASPRPASIPLLCACAAIFRRFPQCRRERSICAR